MKLPNLNLQFDGFTVKMIEYFRGEKDLILRGLLCSQDCDLYDSLEWWDDPKRLPLVIKKPEPEPEDNQDYHTEHCCYNCGCKYGHYGDDGDDKPECPVTSGVKRQSDRCHQPCHQY